MKREPVEQQVIVVAGVSHSDEMDTADRRSPQDGRHRREERGGSPEPVRS